MNDKIEILTGREQGYTAKEAMRHVVEHMKTPSAQMIEVITLKDAKEADSESVLLVKMFMRFLHKNAGKVFLLAQNEDMLLKLAEYVQETYSRIQIMEVANWEEHAMSHDMILNRINGAEAECIIVALSPEEEKEFVEKYRAALDAKIWLGIGTRLRRKRKTSVLTKVHDFWSRHFLKKEK